MTLSDIHGFFSSGFSYGLLATRVALSFRFESHDKLTINGDQGAAVSRVTGN